MVGEHPQINEPALGLERTFQRVLDHGSLGELFPKRILRPGAPERLCAETLVVGEAREGPSLWQSCCLSLTSELTACQALG